MSTTRSHGFKALTSAGWQLQVLAFQIYTNSLHQQQRYFAAAATALPDSAASSSTEHRKWEEIKKSQQESAGDHEQFFKDLEESNDGFEQVAGYFGRGRLR